MNYPRFKSLAASAFPEYEKTKQEIDTLYQSPVSDLVPVAGLEPARDRSQGILSPRCLPFHHTGVCYLIYHLMLFSSRREKGKRKIRLPFVSCNQSVT